MRHTRGRLMDGVAGISGACALIAVLGDMVVFFLVVLLGLRGCRNRPVVLWLFPPVIALWINVHWGVLAGLGMVALWFAADTVGVQRAGRPVEMKSAGAFLAFRAAVDLSSAAALLLNPYGSGFPRFLLETATVPHPFITECPPLSLRCSLAGPARRHSHTPRAVAAATETSGGRSAGRRCAASVPRFPSSASLRAHLTSGARRPHRRRLGAPPTANGTLALRFLRTGFGGGLSSRSCSVRSGWLGTARVGSTTSRRRVSR